MGSSGFRSTRSSFSASPHKLEMKKTTKPEHASVPSDKAFRCLFVPSLLLAVLLHLAAVYWKTPYLWGFHSLYFFPRWLAWALTILVVSFFLPPVNRFMLRTSESTFSVLGRLFSGAGKYWLFAAGGLIFIFVFWALRTKLFLLGDGYFILGGLAQGRIAPTEPLDSIIHQQLFRFLAGTFPQADPSLSYAIPSVISGGAFVFLILTLADVLGKTGFQKILIFSGLITLGSMQLFFGYVESYTFLPVSLALFTLLSALHLRGKVSVLLPLVALVLSIGLHLLAVVFIPSLVYLILWKWRRGEGRLLGFSNLLSLLVSLGIILLVMGRFFLAKFEGVGFSGLLPLVSSPGSSFTLFSGEHIAEFANGLFLVSPAGITLFAFFAICALRFRLLKDSLVNFLLISSLSGLALVFLYNFHWGSADWDLMSFPGLFFTLSGILMFVKWGSRWPKFKYYASILIAVSLFHLIPWILVNAGAPRSIDRYLMIATNDKHLLGTEGGGMWRVARILESAGFAEAAEQVLKQGIQRDPEELGCYTYLGRMLYYQQRYDEAAFYLEKALALEPGSAWVGFSLGQLYLKTGDLGRAVSHLEEAREEYQDDPAFIITLSKAYIGTGRPAEAKDLLEQFLAKNQESATLRGLLGAAFSRLKDYSHAKREWETALRLDPNEPVSVSGMEELKALSEE